MTDDVTLLKVKGEKGFDNEQSRKNYIKSVSSAILAVIAKHGYAKVKSVGASSSNNALKSIIVAKGEAAKGGQNLVVEPCFDSAVFDGGEKTAIVQKVYFKS